MLDILITSKTRVKLLIKFFTHETNKGYLRGLAEEFNESTNSVRVELNRLSEAGILVSEHEGNTKSYSANKKHPLFGEMKSLVAKYLGLDRLVEVVINKLGNVEKAIVVGDYAKGIDSGTIELVLVGREINKEYLDFLIEKAEAKINRRVKVVIYDEEPKGIEGMLLLEL
ncbi:helix-turn-helix domain-containing protein [Echinicola rosea]|uniref:Transcriptional regulator n=1 Tax=Echinicola rosea TaxID=1807691 RepID=A0ABQ1V0S4_9BACT|nr:ArsR family transcriptional regulator [Echinicola rosea]GGF29868.1 transcriptional regulator [Echinicola rosea]